jgi:hypothetical protein
MNFTLNLIHPLFGFEVLCTTIISCKKDKNSLTGDPEIRIAFWSVINDGCGYIDVSIDGVHQGKVKYRQKYEPTNCAESIVSLSVPITKGKRLFVFENACWTSKVDSVIKGECTFYKLEKP